MIEDKLMTLFSFAFITALVPQVWAGFRRRPCIGLFTSGATALTLLVYVVCGVRLGLMFAPVAWAVTAVLWSAIFLQELMWRKIDAINSGNRQ